MKTLTITLKSGSQFCLHEFESGEAHLLVRGSVAETWSPPFEVTVRREEWPDAEQATA